MYTYYIRRSVHILYPETRAVCVSSNDGKSISWLVAATHSKGNDGGEVVDNKILRIQTMSVKSELLPGSCYLSRWLDLPTLLHVEL